MTPTTPLPTLPCELILDIIEITYDQPMLATLSLVCREVYKRCAPRLWQHPHLRGFTDLATIILAIESKPSLARHIQSVAFMCDADDTKKYREHINSDVECSSYFYELPGNDIEKLRAVWKGREGVDVKKPGNEWRAAELLPQIFLHQLDAHGLPPDRRSYAFSFDAPWRWYESFMNAMLALRLSDPERDVHVMRCFCFEGDTHGSLSSDIFKPTDLHLYGQPSDWTHHESPRNTSTFARFPGIKCIVFSIHTVWDEDDDDHCNIFERCHEYDQYHSTGTLEKVVVRMTPQVSGKVRKTFEEYDWPKGRDIVEFRLWDIVGMVPDEAVAHELRNGTWHDWLDQPGVLGRKLSLADLSDLANTVPPISPGGFPASPSLLHKATPAVATKCACCLPHDPNQSLTPNYVTIRS
ncbi:hypothetical protein PILCRDRAFT_821771 [Piloderma croceum F 1598]|uniref:Uncharacterized protein n=1 Tax=Piloderma croceum (strain F 1598) TaxID=765440 RepID=A0A0C3BVC2_PILCF|nr:hypothetical protein PILCRDRAFT_821771 [Piloderma croceum F 1598]